MLQDAGIERFVLGGIFEHGKDAYLDVADILTEETFTVDSHQNIWKCIRRAMELDEHSKIDVGLVTSIASGLGLKKFFDNRQEKDLLNGLSRVRTEQENVRKFAEKLKKLEITRTLTGDIMACAEKMNLSITGEESLDEIFAIPETIINEFIDKLSRNNNDGPKPIGYDVIEYVDFLAANPVQAMGIPGPFPKFNESIGGGFRRKAVHMVGARPKGGKSFFGMINGLHIACNGIPVLYLDTELDDKQQKNRMLANLSGIDINKIETGQFGSERRLLGLAREAANKISEIPFDYITVAGKEFSEIAAIIRRWVTRTVGQTNGVTNDCIVIYDYLKMMNQEPLNSNLAEYQVIGFAMTMFHNLAVKYDIPILAFSQLSREEKVSASDRIAWLCSSLSHLKLGTPEEQAEAYLKYKKKFDRKIWTEFSRFSGMNAQNDDFIHILSELRCGRLHEGPWNSEPADGDNSFGADNVKPDQQF